MITKILVVDDDPIIGQAFARNLRILGYTVFTAFSGAESLALYEREHPDLVLSDMQMEDMNGIALLGALRDLDPEVIVVLITGYADKETVQAGMEAGAADLVPKPIDNVALTTLLRRAEARMRLQRAAHTAQAALHENEARYQAALEQVARLEKLVKAQTDTHCQEVEARERTMRQRAESEIRSLAKFPAEDPNPVMRLRRDGLIMYANAMTRALWPAWGYTAGAFVAAPVQSLAAEALAQHAQRTLDVAYADHVFELHLVPIVEEDYVNLYARDITARRQAERALAEAHSLLEQRVQERTAELSRSNAELAVTRAKAIHASKLASLGEMATGVAHELNQPLTAMQFEADYLKTLIHKKQNEAQPLNEAEIYQIAGNLGQDIARCRRIINYLRAFGRASGEPAIPTHINDPLEDSFVLTGEWLKSQGISIQRELAPDLPLILADAHKLEQVFVNLFSNAAYAMAQREAQEQAISRPYTKQLEVQTYVGDDGAVVVEVRDNGIGIPEKYRDRIFEPFFTTKPVGEGVGLGLSVSYGIVTELGGEITFESAENVGATFRLRFPAVLAH